MRKSKIIKIDGLEITVKELRVRDIYELAGGEGESILERADDLLSRSSDVQREKLMDMTPTDLKTLWDGFKEVNASFLEMAALVGLDDLPGMLRGNLQSQFALLLQTDTEQ